MESRILNFQIHRYKNGHQLVSSTIDLDRSDQDTIDRLSDLSGQLKPGETFEPYFTCYPLPSEKQFVVAKTWQDNTALRAGCVLTKSIIIPINDWASGQCVAFVFSLLNGSIFDPNFPDINTLKSIDALHVGNAPLEELVEALFLEQRQSILIFDGLEREQITSRLYEAFWPFLRKSFAICTFALAPRTIKNRSFDLMFTSSNHKTRFSEWKGRRIEGGVGFKKEIRHRWTHDLVERVFSNEFPFVYKSNNESPFDFEGVVDESTLRLSLLWDELFKKAKDESSPMSVLGLLDIINSQPILSRSLYEIVRPQIEKSIIEAVDILRPEEAWKFYASLLLKHKRKLMDRNMLSRVTTACTLLTARNPLEALYFISSYNPSRQKIPVVLYVAIGNGLSKNEGIDISSILNAIPNELGLQLVSKSLNFSSFLMEKIENEKEPSLYRLLEFLNEYDLKSIHRAKDNVLSFVKSPNHKLILELIFEQASVEIYQKIIRVLINNNCFEFDEFNEIILAQTSRYEAYEFFIDSLTSSNTNKHENVKFLIVHILQKQINLLSHFLSKKSINKEFKKEILEKIFNDTPHLLKKLMFSSVSISKEMYAILSESKNIKREIFAALAMSADVPLIELLPILDEISERALNSLDHELLHKALYTAYYSNISSSALYTVTGKLNQNNAYILIHTLILNKNFNDEIFSRLLLCGSVVKKVLVNDIDILSEKLALGFGDKGKQKIEEQWIVLLQLSNDTQKKRKAATIMLEYSFGKVKSDPTALIFASFPIIYRMYLDGRSFTEKITLWMFSDWDKCKTLREDLVYRYMQSKWPSVGLFLVAKETGIINEVISILKSVKGGKKFLNKAIKEAEEDKSSKTVFTKKTKNQINGKQF